MGVTGATGALNTALPELLERVHKESGDIPTAVGFGISTREHFLSVGKIAEGVVVGSQIVSVLAESPIEQGAKAVEHYCSRLTGKGELRSDITREIGVVEAINGAKDPANAAAVCAVERKGLESGLADQLNVLSTNGEGGSNVSMKRCYCISLVLY
jgi:tryptophan synthase